VNGFQDFTSVFGAGGVPKVDRSVGRLVAPKGNDGRGSPNWKVVSFCPKLSI